MNSRLASVIVLSSFVLNALAQSESHNFSVKDDIARVHFSDPSDAQEDFNSNQIKYSPDGQRVAIVTTRGLLESDQAESSVRVFDLTEIESVLGDPSRRLPQPHVVAVVRARLHGVQMSANAPTIRDIHWSSGSKRLYFRALNALGAMELEEVSAHGGDVRRLTPADYSVDRFDVANDTIVYTAARLGQPAPAQGDRINRDALAVTGYQLGDILFSGQVPSWYPQTFILGIVRPGDDSDSVHRVPGYEVSDIPLLLSIFPFRISPDGHQLATAMPVLKLPEAWKKYDPEDGAEHFRLNPADPALTKSDNGPRPRQYALINLDTGETVPMINGPSARTLGYDLDASTLAWSQDLSRVLVTNVFLPFDAKADSSPPVTKPCRVAAVDLPSMRVRCLFYRGPGSDPDVAHVAAVKFGSSADEVLVSMRSNQRASSTDRFEFEGGIWRPRSSTPAPQESLEAAATQSLEFNGPIKVNIFVRQTLNDPPTLWASDLVTGVSRPIWNPNPQLKEVRFGEASVYRWKDSSGEDWVGGLVKPVGYIPGNRYPLVVQMYAFHQDEFLTDGTEPTAFAARELASVGFMVLQIRKKPTLYSEADAQTALEGYRSAVQSLSVAGLINPQRVGVVGFSWTCWYVINALIKAPKLFAAATIADGLDNSYMQYILFAPGPPNTHEQMDRIRGGSPFGSTQAHWFTDSPGFHLDQVEAPVRIEAINPESVLQEWELYSSLYLQHKPVDLIYFPEGTHVHERPMERFESQQGNIDWLRFWLQGYEDPDPAKRAQYLRWQKMKTSRTTTSTPAEQQ